MPNPTTSWARVWSVPRSLRPRLGGSSFSSGKMENCIRLQKRTLKALVLALVKSSLITLTSCWLLSTLQSGNINSIFLGKKKSTFSFLCGFSFNFVQLCQFCNFCSIFQYLIFSPTLNLVFFSPFCPVWPYLSILFIFPIFLHFLFIILFFPFFEFNQFCFCSSKSDLFFHFCDFSPIFLHLSNFYHIFNNFVQFCLID